MHVTILGSGSPHPDPEAGGSAILITVAGRHYLVDCGHGATQRMVAAGVNPASVGHVFLSHLHYDHVIDLPLFALSSWLVDRAEPLRIFGPAGTADFVGHLFVGGAFDADIRARSQFGRRKENFCAVEPEVTEFMAGTIFEDGRLKVTAVPVKHVDDDIMLCFGMRFDSAEGSVVFSSDTAPTEAIVELAGGVDLLIHECAMDEETMAHRLETKVGIVNHTPPGELGKIATRAGVKSVLAIHQGGKETTNPILLEMTRHHIADGQTGPGYFARTVERIREHYDGPVQVARDLMRIDL